MANFNAEKQRYVEIAKTNASINGKSVWQFTHDGQGYEVTATKRGDGKVRARTKKL